MPVEDMKLANAYGFMLVHLNGNPYFNKFFRLPQHYEIRTKLVDALLDRLNERTDAWEERELKLRQGGAPQKGGYLISNMIRDFCQLTASLLLFHTEKDIEALFNTGKVKHLMLFLPMWNDRYSVTDEDRKFAVKQAAADPDYKMSAEAFLDIKRRQWPAYQLLMILTNGKDEGERNSIIQARLKRGGLNVCGLPECSSQKATDGGQLLQCTQCGTVRYVSVEGNCEMRHFLKLGYSALPTIRRKHGRT